MVSHPLLTKEHQVLTHKDILDIQGYAKEYMRDLNPKSRLGGSYKDLTLSEMVTLANLAGVFSIMNRQGLLKQGADFNNFVNLQQYHNLDYLT